MIEGIDGGTTAVWLLGALTLAAAVADWWAVAREHRAAERIAKPATLLLLLATALAAGATGSAAGTWLVVALAFGALGDIALLGDSNRRFVVGLALFLVGHLSYAAAFLALGEPQARGLLIGLVALVVALIAGRAVLPAVLRDHGLGLAAPVALYMAVIGAMLVLAGGTGDAWVLVGGAVFVASDTVLALDRFARPARWRAPLPHLTVMVAYHLGQALIVYGVLA